MPTATKLDLYKQHKADYAAPRKPTLVVIGPARYLTITGRGEPGGEVFQQAIGALYGVAYTIKMTGKLERGEDYKVCALEGIWWGNGPDGCFVSQPKSEWNWTLLIRTPEFITKDHLKAAVSKLLAKGKDDSVKQVKIETLKEGRCVQMLHVGPYEEEKTSIKHMVQFADHNGLKLHGRHHEIYLSDPRRVPPERLRTILRHPVHAK